MNICFIGKHPPIQGGVSRENFWTSYALAQEGFDIHVVTNAQEVEYHYRNLDDPWFAQPLEKLSASAPGTLTIHSSSSSRRHSHIPWANPFVTKLATIATTVIETYGCELIYSYYLEPYALAAYLASQWTHVPYGLRHAGSDVGRLLLCPDLRGAYEHVIRAADFVFASSDTFRRFLHLGVDLDTLYFPVHDSLPTEYFHPDATPLDINTFVDVACKAIPETQYRGVYQRFARKVFDPALPSVGIYGKIGRSKGSFDLLQALRDLRASGLPFNFLALTQGHPQTVLDFAQQIEEYGLADVTWLLPFIPQWSIPNFIRACTAVCFLERDFPIKIHQPAVAREVFACGTCLVLSHEIVNKQFYADKLRPGSNVFLVDPLNIAELADTLRTVLEDPAASREVGMNGYRDISAGFEDFAAYGHNLASLFSTIQQDVALRRNSMSVAEMQACLARLYTDDSFRKLFDLAPEASLGNYKLTAEETSALKSIDKLLLHRFANSLKAKRKDRFRTAYPLLFALAGVDINRYFDRFYHLYPAKPRESTLLKILEFGSFMEQCLATDEDAPSYASDLAHYERVSYATAYTPGPQDTFASINAAEELPAPPVNLDTCPVIRQGIAVEAFAYDIVKIANALQEQQEPGEVKESRYYFVFQQPTGSLTPRIFAISPATYELLVLCDGSRSVATLVSALEQRFGRDHLEAEIIRMAQHLLSIQVLGG
ncbi:MAG: glycosyltransferase [Ktedonobacteraceae bacterium]|nr:glycosyltransferase [Ktedonobacteraceae bacterium]